jgi:hypothetical protein
MAMTMTEFLTLADADLDKIWHEDETPYETQYTKVMNIVNQSDLYKRDAKMTGFGPMVEIPEGGDVTFDTAIAPVTRRYDLIKRGLGYKITDKLWKFDRYGEVKKFEGGLRRADDDDTEQYFFGIYNNATATTVSTGFDGLALASTAHTRLDGGATQQNRPTSLVAFSLTALEDAVIAFTKFVDDRGRPYKSMPQTLLGPLDLVLSFEEVLKSTLNPTNANNAVNAVRMFNLSPLNVPYITSTTYWSLLGANHDINALWNQRPAADSDIHWESDTIKRKVTKWLGRGHGEWRDYYQGNS